MKVRVPLVSGALFALTLAAAAAGPAPVKLTQYDRAGSCDLAVGPDGTLHAVFTDRPEHGKPLYLYYRASRDGGRTWGDAVTLSDDESGNDAGHARLFLDSKGRLYAAWKYVAKNSLLDGPGGHAPGRLVYRCLAGGAWSKRVLLGDDKVPRFSWFAAVAPDGQAHLVWSQMAKDAAAAVAWGTSDYADLVRQATLDGPAVARVKDLIVPRPLVTAQEQQRLRALGKYPKYEDTRPRQDGLINLRGHVAADGTVHFVAEHPGIKDGPSANQTGRRIVLWDGARLVPVYAFDKYRSYNTFNDPPALLVDAAGKRHLLRAPEKAEKPCVRDYPVNGGELGDPVDVVRPKSGPGAVLNWQAHQLPGGRMAVTVALSQKGGYNPDDAELYVSYSDGDGKWSEPASLTPRAAGNGKTGPNGRQGNPVTVIVQYQPRFAALAVGKDGRPCLLLIDGASTLAGISRRDTANGRDRVVISATPRTDNPAVYFLKF